MPTFSGLEHILCEGVALSPFTSLRLGGDAQYFAQPTSEEELVGLVQQCSEQDVRLRVIGGGSNILIPDDGFSGMVVSLDAACFCQIEVDGNRIHAGAGAKLAHLLSIAAKNGLSGVEQLAGIAGSVGGAVRTNAGTHSGDIGQVTKSVHVINSDGEVSEKSGDDLRFSYRQSNLDDVVAIRATFELEPALPEEITKQMQTLWIIKKSQQPTGVVGHGCVFRDHGGITAASLIEQAGMKGHSVGAVGMSESHPNYLIVNEGGTSRDALQLVQAVHDAVLEHSGVSLATQLEVW